MSRTSRYTCVSPRHLFPTQTAELLALHHYRYFQPKIRDNFNRWNKVLLTFSILTICHTCMMLSSETEQITHGSLGFQEKSEIFAV